MSNTIKFRDAAGNAVKCEWEITHRNGYPEFTMSGEYGGGLGQIRDHIKPATNAQKNLVALWKEWHLNGMNAGTTKQEKILEKAESKEYTAAMNFLDSHTIDGKPISKIDYDSIGARRESLKKAYTEKTDEIKQAEHDINALRAWMFDIDHCRNPKIDANITRRLFPNKKNVSYLNFRDKYRELKKALPEMKKELPVIKAEYDAALLSTALYDLHPKTGEIYKYGAAWLRRDLPNGFEATVQELCKVIEKEEEERSEEENAGASWEDIDDEKIRALAQHVEIGPGEAVTDITHTDGNQYNYAGTFYLVCDDEEADEECEAELNSYIDECILPEIPERQRKYYDREKFIQDAMRIDGRGHCLNRYNGEEYNETVDGTEYYIYQA